MKEEIDFDLSPEDLSAALTLAGAEVESIRSASPGLEKVVVGRVLSCEEDPEHHYWKWCELSLGKKKISLLCGASNIRPGLLVAVALPGAVLPGGLKVGERKFGDRISAALVCSELELGLGEDHSGIMELPGKSRPGESLVKALDLEDWVLDLDITPNRPDLLSVRGVAREIAALVEGKLKNEEFTLPEGTTPVEKLTSVTIEDYRSCPRYCARIIRGIKIRKSPFWLRHRLSILGFRPINNVVDATNYVMVRWGQPLHAFDLRKLKGGRIVVRPARKGEKITTIDEKEHELDRKDLVIADESRPVALAGVMGGIDTEVEDSTSELLLESAYFDPRGIRMTSKRLGLASEASHRFERGIDPELPPDALDRVCALIVELAGGEIASGKLDLKVKDFNREEVWLRPARTSAYLGVEIKAEVIRDILEGLGLRCREEHPERLLFQVPTWRPDLTREVDLIEEVARRFGYRNIPATLPTGTVAYRPRAAEEELQDRIRGVLVGLGLNEIISYSFMSSADLKGLRLSPEQAACSAVEVLNPVNREQNLLRTTLIPGLLRVVLRNRNRKADRIELFELGKIFFPRGKELPEEYFSLGIVLAGGEGEDFWQGTPEKQDFYSLKGKVEVLLSRLKISEVRFLPAAHPAFQPGRTVQIFAGERELGLAGAINERVLENFSLEGPVFLAELREEELLSAWRREIISQPLPLYPAVTRDLAVIVKEEVSYDLIRGELENLRPEILESYTLFDLYRGEPIPEGEKSLAFHLRYRSPRGTLLEEEVSEVHGILKEGLARRLNCRFRE